MGRSKHSKKDIENALRYAESHGWRVEISAGNGHCWGQLYCPFNDEECRCGTFCRISVWSTPKNPGNHGRKIRQVVDNYKPLQQESESNGEG